MRSGPRPTSRVVRGGSSAGSRTTMCSSCSEDGACSRAFPGRGSSPRSPRGLPARSPRSDAPDAVARDPHHEARRRVVHRRELHVRAEVGEREALQQLRGTALLESRTAVKHEVLLQPGRVDLRPFERQGDARLASDVLQLALIAPQMPGDELVSVEADPDASHLGRAVLVQRDQVRQRAGLDQVSRAAGQFHGRSLAHRIARMAVSVLEAEPPRFSAADAEQIAAELFGLAGTAVALGSERDQAFLIDDGAAGGVLKISNSGEDPAVLELEREAVLHVERVDPALPVALPTPAEQARGHYVRFFERLAGRHWGSELGDDAVYEYA